MIQSLTLTNFKKSVFGTVYFQPLNLITGENARGKTAILQGLELAATGGLTGLGKTNQAIFSLARSGTGSMAVDLTMGDGVTLRREWSEAGKTVKRKEALPENMPQWNCLAATEFMAAKPGIRLAMLAAHCGQDWGELEQAAGRVLGGERLTVTRGPDSTILEWVESVIDALKARKNAFVAAGRQHEASLGSIAELVANDPLNPPPDTQAEWEAAAAELATKARAVAELEHAVDVGREAAEEMETLPATDPGTAAEYAARAEELRMTLTRLEREKIQLEAEWTAEEKKAKSQIKESPECLTIPPELVDVDRSENARLALEREMIELKHAITAGEVQRQRMDVCGDDVWMDLAEAAWGIIANVSGGDWTAQTADWRMAAERWREKYHGLSRPVGPVNPISGMATTEADILNERVRLNERLTAVKDAHVLCLKARKAHDAKVEEEAVQAANAYAREAAEKAAAVRKEIDAKAVEISRENGEWEELNNRLRTLREAQREWDRRQLLIPVVKAGEDAAAVIQAAIEAEMVASSAEQAARARHESFAPARLEWAAAQNRARDLGNLRTLADEAKASALKVAGLMDGLQATQNRILESAIEPVVGIMRRISAPILDGEGFCLHATSMQIGRWEGPKFLPFPVLSGAEQLLAVACLQVALAGSGDRILILDEVSRMDTHHRARLLELVENMVAAGELQQAILVDLNPDGYSERWHVIAP